MNTMNSTAVKKKSFVNIHTASAPVPLLAVPKARNNSYLELSNRTCSSNVSQRLSQSQRIPGNISQRSVNNDKEEKAVTPVGKRVVIVNGVVIHNINGPISSPSVPRKGTASPLKEKKTSFGEIRMDVNTQDQFGYTKLYKAVGRGNLPLIKDLLKKGSS